MIDTFVDHDEPPVFDDLAAQPGSKLAATFLVVATRSAIGDWAAYFGPEEWGPEQVGSNGYKLPREAAIQLFPNISGPYCD